MQDIYKVIVSIVTKTHTSETVGSKQLDLYKRRSKKIRLIWCKAVCDILDNFYIKKINDLGCNYFQLFKEMYLRKLKYDYFGYDADQKFINIGLDYLAKLKGLNKNKIKRETRRGSAQINNLSFNYIVSNIEKDNLRNCDCTILSAILEHVDRPNIVLKKVFKTTKKIIILRTFVDLKAQEGIQIKSVKKPYNIRKFSFNFLKKIFFKNGFRIYFILDEATEFSKKTLYVNNGLKFSRNHYICLGIRK
jgi:SAM-dependent methyltransferase